MPRNISMFVCAVLVSTLAIQAATAPQVFVTDSPGGMGQVGGGSAATDSFTLTNAGPGDAIITIGQKGNFFSVSPTSFTLAVGAVRTVSIRSTTQNNGVADGTINVFTAGVTQPIALPVRLFVGSRPNGTVTPVPSGPQGTSGLPNEFHAGSITVSNRGNVGMQGILVSDVPWILPQGNLIGIPSNGKSTGQFTVDPTRRPDGEAALGAITGAVSLVYLNGTSNNSASAVTAAAPPSGRVTVSVLDVSKPTAAPGQPASLAPGEIALFIAGLSQKGGASTDLFLSNRTSTSIPNVKLFYSASGAPITSALLASVPQLASNITAWFPAAPQLVFNQFNQIGTLQVRNPAATSVAMSAILSISPDLITTFLTSVPVLRSDRGTVAMLFAGVDKKTGVHTDMLIQETSGNAGTVTLDFFDQNGNAVGAPRTESLTAFGLRTVENAVPAGALAAKATAGGAAKISGYAVVVDENTLDSWIITDPRAPSGAPGEETMIAPLLAMPSAASVDFFVTGDAAVGLVGGRRRHAVRAKSVGLPEVAATAANGTKKISYPAGTGGYLRITGSSGTFTSSGRVSLNKTTGGGAFGGAIPVRRAADAAVSGSSRRVSGIDDLLSGPHPSLTLIESLGSSANARVTVRFTFNAGSTTTGQITASKDYALSAGQMLTISDVLRAVVGSGRDTLGDLRRIVIDVDVTSGGGGVLSFVQTIDKASGDITVITD